MATRLRADVDIQVQARGPMTPDLADTAREKVRNALRIASEPVLAARVTLVQSRDPAVERGAVAKVGVDVNGRPVRVQVAAPTMREAVDAMIDRLRHRLVDLDRHWEALRGRTRPPDGGPDRRLFTAPSRTSGRLFVPPDERTTVVHVTAVPETETVDEAAFDLTMLDFDFLLFTEVTTGQDVVLDRESPTSYRLRMPRPVPTAALGPVAVDVTVDPTPAPVLSLVEAKARLEDGRLPFVFFVDVESGRGRLLHLRYDGNYGVVTPA